MDNQMPQWIDRELTEILASYHIEIACIEGMTTFICPRMPPPAVKGMIEGKIPSTQNRQFVEGISFGTLSQLREEVKNQQATAQMTSLPGHRFILDVFANEGTTLAVENASTWRKILIIISQDSFVESFVIRFDGKTIFTSDLNGVTLMRKATEEILSELDTRSTDKGLEQIHVKMDDRFDYDRDFLPPDVATDVKILLESCSSVEEFLSQI